jgi:hypothetical protein
MLFIITEFLFLSTRNADIKSTHKAENVNLFVAGSAGILIFCCIMPTRLCHNPMASGFPLEFTLMKMGAGMKKLINNFPASKPLHIYNALSGTHENFDGKGELRT